MQTRDRSEIPMVGFATWFALFPLSLVLPVLLGDDATLGIYGAAVASVGVLGLVLTATKRLRSWGIGLLVGLGASLVSDFALAYLALSQMASQSE